MNNSNFKNRQDLRRIKLAERDTLSAPDRQSFSATILASFRRNGLFERYKSFFIYCSVRSEVETSLLLRHCLLAGKTVSVPLAVPEISGLQAVQLTDPDVELSPGYLGILEPVSQLAVKARVDATTIEVVVLPGVVFDRAGHRLGYGGGYYDRFLANEAPQAFRVGLAYSLQVIESIPAEPHDVPLDLLITERETLAWRR